MAAETIVIDIVANFRNQTSAGMNSAKQSADRFSDSVRKSKREMDRLGGTHAKPKVSLVDKASSTLDKIDRGLKGFKNTVVSPAVRLKDYATSKLSKIKNALFSLKGLVAAVGTGMAVNFATQKLISNPIGIADAYSGAKIGFSNLLGDTGGQKMMDDLDAFAKRTPFNTSGVINNAQKMLAMGWEAKDIIKDMETIGNAAAATGKGEQGLESIVRALSQIKTKGKLSTEELNQLSEAGISAKAMLAEQLGYGTGDKGIAAMTADLEDGLIGSEVAVQALLKGMKQFDGTMERTANETVEGLKSQIADAFEINILRRWGQGLQDGAKRGLGSVLELLDKSEGKLESLGDTVYEIGKELSNWAADKLEDTIDKILEVSESEEFKNASFGGKIKIMWDEVIAKPFDEWWDSKGKAYMADKLASFGEGLGSGMSKGIMALLGVDVIGATGEAASLGGSFASGFAKGFESKKVWDAIVDAAGRAIKSGFTSLFTGSALERIIVGGIALKVTSGIVNGLTSVQTLWSGTGAVTGTGALTLGGMGLKGMIGSTGTAMVGGSGIKGMLASLGYASTGGAATSTLSGGMAAFTGLGTALGIAGGVAGGVNAIGDLTKAVQAQTKNDQKLYGTRSATKAGMVGTGAFIGSIFGPVGTAVGAGIGGLATFLAGNKLADAISGVSKSTEEMNEEFEKTAQKNMAKRFGEGTLSADQLAEKVSEVFGAENISRVNKFTNSLKDLSTIQENLANNKFTVDYAHERIMAGEKLSKSDIEGYKTALQSYASATSDVLSGTKSNTTAAYQLLWGDDTKGLQKATKSMNSMYGKLEKQLSERSGKLNDVIAKAFEDGKITINEEKKINEIIKQIEEIEKKIEERLRKKEEAKNEASYDLIGMKYKNTDLSADSFKDMMKELDEQSKTTQQAYDDAYIEASADLKLQLKVGEIDQSEYDKKLKEVEKKWRNGKAITVKKTVNVAFDVLNTHYSDELESIEKALEGSLYTDDQLTSLKISTLKLGPRGEDKGFKWDENSTLNLESMKDSFLNSAGIDGAMQKEMKSVYESLKPQEKDLKELKESYEEAGEKVPKWIEDSLEDIANVKLMSGDSDSFFKLIGEQIATKDKDYAEKLIKNAGAELPKALKEGLEEGLKNTEVNANANVDVDASVKTDKAAEKTKNETKGALGKDQTVPKTANVPVTSKTSGTETAAEKAYQELKTPLDRRFGISISESGKVSVNGISISGAAAAISSAWEKFKGWVKEKFSIGVSVTSNVRVNQRMGVTDNSQKKTKKANGGYVDRAITALVGEAGPEMIIPLSANRRQRGKTLWERAGRAMGLLDSEVIPNANGGLYGVGSSRLGEMLSGVKSVGNTEGTQRSAGGGSVNVNVGGVTITIQSTGQGVQQDINANADAIAGQIAEILQKAFQNMPVTVGTT